jgi:hypothetical protein
MKLRLTQPRHKLSETTLMSSDSVMSRLGQAEFHRNIDALDMKDDACVLPIHMFLKR